MIGITLWRRTLYGFLSLLGLVGIVTPHVRKPLLDEPHWRELAWIRKASQQVMLWWHGAKMKHVGCIMAELPDGLLRLFRRCIDVVVCKSTLPLKQQKVLAGVARTMLKGKSCEIDQRLLVAKYHQQKLKKMKRHRHRNVLEYKTSY